LSEALDNLTALKKRAAQLRIKLAAGNRLSNEEWLGIAEDDAISLVERIFREVDGVRLKRESQHCQYTQGIHESNREAIRLIVASLCGMIAGLSEDLRGVQTRVADLEDAVTRPDGSGD
jgi:hypothetical protein